MSSSGLITSFFTKVEKTDKQKTDEMVKKIMKEKHSDEEKSDGSTSSLVSSFSRLLKQQLTPSQVRAFDLVRKGHNIFITGSAGTGKSFLINAIKQVFALEKVWKVQVLVLQSVKPLLRNMVEESG